MAYHQSTLQRAASCYGSVSILDGVKFKVGEKFKPPKKVTLPVGWHQNDPSDVLSLTYDFSLEKDVLAKCEAEKLAKEMENSRLKEHEMLMEAMTVSSSSASPKTESSVQPANNSISSAIYANVNAGILTPVTASSTNNIMVNSDVTRNSSFNIKDFENDAMTPFELVELQTINNMDALKSLLQPELQSTPTSTTSPVSVNQNITTVADQQLIDVSNLVNSGIPSTQNSSIYSTNPDATRFSLRQETVTQSVGVPSYCHGTQAGTNPTVSYSAGQHSVLISVDDNKPLFQPVSLRTSPSNQGLPGQLSGGAVCKVGHLPPLVVPVRPGPPQVPPRTYKNLVDAQNGAVSERGIDVSENSIPGGCVQSGRSPEPIPRGYTPPSLGQETVVLNSYGEVTDIRGSNLHCRSSPILPPIHNASNDTTVQTMPVSCLPDPYSTMNESDKNFVSSISSMGFPNARVARAVLRLGQKEREVIDFLIQVEEFSASGYPGDSIEVALIEYNMDKDKALEFLKVASTLSELGFQAEDIHEALKKTDNNTDKALDYLMK